MSLCFRRRVKYPLAVIGYRFWRDRFLGAKSVTVEDSPDPPSWTAVHPGYRSLGISSQYSELLPRRITGTGNTAKMKGILSIFIVGPAPQVPGFFFLPNTRARP